MMRGRYNSSSIEGGIFGENPIKVVALPKSHTSYSSIEGGIFGQAAARPITPRESITRSSIPGGVFGGHPEDSENAGPAMYRSTPRIEVTNQRVAGFKAKDSHDSSAPLAASRSDPNRSSVEGGIFGPGTSVCSRPQSARIDPNRSSVQGGIFG